MAGYRAPGERFINATTKNDQIVDQRTKYREKNRARGDNANLGVSRDTTSLFRFDEGGLDSIFEASVDTFSELDLTSSPGNPDFTSQIMFDHIRSQDMFDNVSAQSDKPNRKGPNLIAPDIDDATFSNDERQESQFTNRGFGWRDQRNEPATNASRIGEYFSKHYKIDGEDLVKPVLGEAKNPAEDPNIDYDQS